MILRQKLVIWLYTSLFLAVMLCIPFTGASAQPIAENPCDPKYFDSLEARAWLEAQREITQNQNLIFKPDSVLEYTCFDGYLKELADHADEMFSENFTRWGEILPITSMDNALQNLVVDAMNTYINENFEKPGYDLLGGRLNEERIDHEGPFNVVGIGGSYECDIMNRVWMEAKCMDFIDNTTHDGFYTFAEYIDFGEDHRFLPTVCQPFIADDWQRNLDTALIQPAGTPWIEEIIHPYIEELTHDFCGDSIPLATGLKVRRPAGGAPYDEHACVPPGCHYVPGDGCVPN